MADVILHDGVEFRTLDDWPGYAVSRCGKVVCCLKRIWDSGPGEWRLLKPVRMNGGYLHVDCCGGSQKKKRMAVHRLVLMSWTGPCPAGHQCRHINGDRHDNRLENLAWGTVRENYADQRRHGTASIGSRQSSAKLTEADIPAIRRMLEAGKTKASIGRQYGVSGRTITYIANGEHWAHV